MKHIHLFQHIGGGCGVGKCVDMGCDDSYECECGAKFTTKSDAETHFTMPEYIAGKETPEPIEVNLPTEDILPDGNNPKSVVCQNCGKEYEVCKCHNQFN